MVDVQVNHLLRCVTGLQRRIRRRGGKARLRQAHVHIRLCAVSECGIPSIAPFAATRVELDMQCVGHPVANTSHVEQLVFMGMAPPVDAVDTLLLKYYAADLHAPAHDLPGFALWVLLLLDSRSSADAQDLATRMHADAVALAEAIGAGVCVWTFHGAMARLPRLHAAFERSNYTARGPHDEHLARYFWMHTSLLLWTESVGKHYPGARYFWRLEPDVMVSGKLSALLRLTSADDSDLLLPKFEQEQRTGASYPHWEANRELLLWSNVVPLPKRTYSLVSIGRYSSRFLEYVTDAYWEAGIGGYEEILFPIACAAASLGWPKPLFPCKSAGLSSGGGVGKVKARRVASTDPSARVESTHYAFAEHLRNRPAVECELYARSLRLDSKLGRPRVWHPVKDRKCAVDALFGFTFGHDRFEADPDRLQLLERADLNRTLAWQ